VESLWRYPVKSMRGEELAEAFAGFAGVHGDRLYAFRSSSAPAVFPYLTAREQERMLLCRPVYRHPAEMVMPPLLAETEAIGPGLTTAPVDAARLAVDVETPGGERFAIDDPRLISVLRESIGEEGRHQLTLARCDRAMTDCRPISLFSVQTARQMGEELGAVVDKRRFRANVYVDLKSGAGFGEDEWVGRTLRIGARAEIKVLERDPRCKMITLDPETGQAEPEIIKRLARAHESKAGVYAAVLVEGAIRPGDEIRLL
jgi:uncharacterized protein YcbX